MGTPRKGNGHAKRPVQETLNEHHQALEDHNNANLHLASEMRAGFEKMNKRFNRLETMFSAVLRHAYVPPILPYPLPEDKN